MHIMEIDDEDDKTNEDAQVDADFVDIVDHLGTEEFKYIYLNPEDSFFKDIKVDIHTGLTFAYLHEISHNIFNHLSRGNGKDQHLWGYATDYFINLFLRNIELENKECKMVKKLPIMFLINSIQNNTIT